MSFMAIRFMRARGIPPASIAVFAFFSLPTMSFRLAFSGRLSSSLHGGVSQVS